MILLAVQYCAQPPLTRKFLDGRANKKGITMVEEIVKMVLSALFFLSCGEFICAFELVLIELYFVYLSVIVYGLQVEFACHGICCDFSLST